MKLSSIRRARPNQQMRLRYIFVMATTALLLVFAAMPLHAQDSDDGLLRRGDRRPPPPRQPGLPVMPPTAQPAPATAPQPPPAATSVATQGSPTVLNAPTTHRARVTFTNGLLEVRANNSSLLQILHDVSRITGMAITGGVAEQNIFGDYGPASPATVLATLLNGTGANMLLRQDPLTGAPVELVLTQRAGGGVPASPNGPGFDDSPFPPENAPAPRIQATITAAPAQPQPDTPPPAAAAQNPVNPVPNSPVGVLSPPPPGLVGAPNPQPGTTRNANGTTTAATPESIFEQLQQMQKAKAAAVATLPAATPPPTPAGKPGAAPASTTAPSTKPPQKQ